MSVILPVRFYGDPSELVDELRAMERREAEWLASRSEEQILKARIQDDIEEWRLKNGTAKGKVF